MGDGCGMGAPGGGGRCCMGTGLTDFDGKDGDQPSQGLVANLIVRDELVRFQTQPLTEWPLEGMADGSLAPS